MSPNSPSERLTAGAMLALALAGSAAADPEPRNIIRPAAEHAWKRQSPELPTQLTVLWGDRDRDGTFGQLVRMPPGKYKHWKKNKAVVVTADGRVMKVKEKKEKKGRRWK